jgi:hypothetical protein
MQASRSKCEDPHPNTRKLSRLLHFGVVWKHGLSCIFKKINFFLLKINFFMFSDRFDVLISKIKFFLKYHFNVFLNKKHFELQLQPQPHLQIKTSSIVRILQNSRHKVQIARNFQ